MFTFHVICDGSSFTLQEDIVETFLTDTTGPEDICLTRDLIREGHADRREDSALKVSDDPACHRSQRAIRKNVASARGSRAVRAEHSEADVGSICESVDVRSVAESVRRFAAADADADAGASVASDNDTTTLLSVSLARRVSRISRTGRIYERDSQQQSESGSSNGSTATLLSSRILLRKLQLHKSRKNGPGPEFHLN